MDLRQLRTFVAVAELGTVSRAASHLHVAQPALSRQIIALEEELGVRLFDRVAGGMRLSSPGEALLVDCRGLLNYSRELLEHSQRLRRPDAGVLKVAASPHFLETVFPEFLRRYGERFPEVQVRLFDNAGYASTVAMLERGELHLAQGSMRTVRAGDNPIAGVALQPIQMMAAFHPGLRLTAGDDVEIAKLAKHRLLQIGAEYYIRRTFDAACRLAGFDPNNALESHSPHALLAMAEAGHGVAIIPSALRISPYRLQVARVTFRKKPLSEPLGILYDRRRAQPRYASDFCTMLAAHAREVFPITRPGPAPPRAAAPRKGRAP